MNNIFHPTNFLEMPYFTFTFREQVYQAQFEIVADFSGAHYRVFDMPETLHSLIEQDILLHQKEGNAVKPGWDLGDVISDGINQAVKGIHHI